MVNPGNALPDIGPYRLLDVLGEGGMGVVYAAEQRKPIFRRVALKVIKVGMDTKEVLARFEAERQALALLDHPNVAKVLDAGATAEGRPFFAMELVRGLAITRYCDEGRLSVNERVDLMMQACAALQHAHERGIIHRDIKPTNLLVTEIDGKPVVKVIDFGLAKAINQRLTERTLFTEEGRIIGTPEYMSPEQAETSAQDVDARSDVFSLGVVLYELIAGALPFDFKAARAKGYFEVQRCIREEEPPTPRQRLSSLRASLEQVLALRRCRMQELAVSLKNGLDAVIMKAIAKQRRERYSSCAEFAADLQRFLAGEQVLARKVGAMGSLRGRLRRFRRRNPAVVPVIATCLVAPVVVMGALSALWVSRRQEDPRPSVAVSPSVQSARTSRGGDEGSPHDAPAALALLVGINRTPNGTVSEPPAIEGAENDVARLRNVLIDRFGFEPARIRVLKTAFATHEAIVRAFDEHLIQQAGPNTKVVFAYSGGGSRVLDSSGKDTSPRDPSEPPHDETIVAYDSRAVDPAGGFDITDDELYSLVAALRSTDVVVITDCCHSGGLAPSSGSAALAGKLFASDVNSTPAALAAFWPKRVRFVDDGEQIPLPSLVQLASCGAAEKSSELTTKMGVHGAFSWFLAQSLDEANARASWGEIQTIVRARVAGCGTRVVQTVAIVGDRDRAVFWGRARPATVGYDVTRIGSTSMLAVQAGRLAGVTEGVILRLLDFDGRNVGVARVSKVGPTTCSAEWTGHGAVPDVSMRALPETALREVSEVATDSNRHQIRLSVDDGVDRSVFDGCSMVRLVSGTEQADFVVRSVGTQLGMFDRVGECVRTMPADRSSLHRQLWDEAIHQSLMGEVGPRGTLQIGVTVEEVSSEEAGRRQMLPARVRQRTRSVVVGADEIDDRARGGGLVKIVITNKTDQDLHVAMISVSQDRERNLLLGKGMNDIVTAGNRHTKLVLVGRPAGWPAWKPMTDRYVVVATPRYTDLHPFESDWVRSRGDSSEARPPTLHRVIAGDEPLAQGAGQEWGLTTLDLEVVTRVVFEAAIGK